MINTAKSVGIDWEKYSKQLRNKVDWESLVSVVKSENFDEISIPNYYVDKFHGYQDGNLCIDAAIEQEVAGKAVGARNFPEAGKNGEDMLRSAYDNQLTFLGANIRDDSIVLDFGCGTGTSTRRLARKYPKAKQIIGLDLSPYMIAVGRYLQLNGKDIEWVDDIVHDSRITLRQRDITNTSIPDSSVALVSLCLVLHELPSDVTMLVLQECFRILEPGGILAIMEMDPDAPGYRKLQASPFLFSVLRSTEPYLEQYFQLAPTLSEKLLKIGFPVIRCSAATGRHLTIVALKGGVLDFRPCDEVRSLNDKHISTLKSSRK
jgi:ubiquinone/menaquinone biosynthesis C-methylase UbiE